MSGGPASGPDRLSYWLGILSGERKGLGPDLMRMALAVLSGLYGAGLEVYLAAERIGARRRMVLPTPVISIGNLTSGGTGKTPMTHYVARRLAEESLNPAILSRGHGGSLSRQATIVSDRGGNILHAADAVGDEAASLARMLPGVPVCVGKDRRMSARLMMERFAPGVLVLDDGFQYWQLARDLDIVLLDSRRPFDNGYPLPRGLLREPKEHLRRAGIVVVTRADLASAAQLGDTVREAERLSPNAAVFTARHEFAGLRPLNDAAERSLPDRPLAVCGIAQPDAFAALLRSSGIETAGPVISLGDHAVYGPAVMERIGGKMREYAADGLVTTEKDAVKIDADTLRAPALAVRMEIQIEREDLFWTELLSRSGLFRTRTA